MSDQGHNISSIGVSQRELTAEEWWTQYVQKLQSQNTNHNEGEEEFVIDDKQDQDDDMMTQEAVNEFWTTMRDSMPSVASNSLDSSSPQGLNRRTPEYESMMRQWDEVSSFIRTDISDSNVSRHPNQWNAEAENGKSEPTKTSEEEEEEDISRQLTLEGLDTWCSQLREHLFKASRYTHH
jgi:hypothetical protein